MGIRRIVFVVAFFALLVGGASFLAGCRLFGGFSNEVTPSFASGVVMLNATVTAPAGGAGFSASVRNLPAPSILAGARARRYVGRVKVAKIVRAILSEIELQNGTTLKITDAPISVPTGKNEIALEILPASNTESTPPLYKTYFTETVEESGTTRTDQPVNVDTTVKALAFDEWEKTNPGMTVSDFMNTAPKLATLTTLVTDRLTSLGTADPATFSWGVLVQEELKKVASSPVSPTATGTPTLPQAATHTVEVGCVPVENPTGVMVSPGDSLSFAASGTWRWGETCDANGTPGRPHTDELPMMLNGPNMGALIGRIATGAYFFIGTSSTITVPATAAGQLFLAMNERLPVTNWRGDNSGSITVTITLSH